MLCLTRRRTGPKKRVTRARDTGGSAMSESIEHAGLTIRIEPDDDPESPREWDSFGKMVCFHRRYDLGDEHDYRSDDYSGWDEMEDAIQQEEDAAVVLPLYLYDHSGITMSAGPFSCPWDSGQVGFTFISKADLRKEYGLKRISKVALKKAEKLLIAEVEEYDQYLTGDVWGYVIERDGEEVSSCWGFFGDKYCVEEAKRVAESIRTLGDKNGC